MTPVSDLTVGSARDDPRAIQSSRVGRDDGPGERMAAERLKIDVSTLGYRHGQVAHVVLQGVLDGQTVEAFEAILDDAVRAAPTLVLDLERLTWISSAGAGAFLVAARRAEQAGGSLVLARPGRQVRDVIVALGLEKLLPMGATLEEAVGQLRSGPHAKPARR